MTLGADARTRARLARIGTHPITSHQIGTMLHRGPYLAKEGDGDGDGDGDNDGDGDDDDTRNRKQKPEGWNDSIQDYVTDLVKRETIKARKDAKKAAEAEQARKDEEARKEAERKADEDSGEYEKVKAQLQQDVKDRDTTITSITAERDTLQAFFDAEYTRALENLPEIVLAFKPEDDASVAEKTAWLSKALANAEKVSTTTGTVKRPTGNGVPPKPKEKTEQEREQEARAVAARRGTYSSM